MLFLGVVCALILSLLQFQTIVLSLFSTGVKQYLPFGTDSLMTCPRGQNVRTRRTKQFQMDYKH